MDDHDLDRRIETYRVRVRGAVQGVGYRNATVRRAHALRVTGWVANMPDGTVEAVVQGAANQVDRMLEWMRQGPAMARVRELEAEEDRTNRRYDRFETH
ncbi:MAG: acylphosphatase [Janthinobacterium lividum]